LPEGEESRYGDLVAPGLYGMARFTSTFSNVRLEMSVDGSNNSVLEVHTERLPPGADTPYKNGFLAVSTPIVTEKQSLRKG